MSDTEEKIEGSRREWVPFSHNIVGLRPIAEAPRDGREILCTDGLIWRVCVPKAFMPDIWEFHRDENSAPGHSWSMAPTHYILLEDLPQVQK